VFFLLPQSHIHWVILKFVGSFFFYVVEWFLVTARQLVPALMVQMLTVWWQSTYSTLYHK